MTVNIVPELHDSSLNRRSQFVAQSILNMITAGELNPGARLPTESQLCDQFRVSRTTLREAIQTLRARGLLDVSPGRGSFIRHPSIPERIDDVALALHLCPQQDLITIQPLLGALLLNTLPSAIKAPVSARQLLFRHIVMQDAPAETNLELEHSWYNTYLHLDPFSARCNLLACILSLLHSIERYRLSQTQRSSTEIIRISQHQLRATTALVEGDSDRLRHAITQWMIPTPPPQLTSPRVAA